MSKKKSLDMSKYAKRLMMRGYKKDLESACERALREQNRVVHPLEKNDDFYCDYCETHVTQIGKHFRRIHAKAA